jgi:2-polyprenyl-6-methoxyphenol hydroxylase-like FAD-dependent oxidoreductase
LREVGAGIALWANATHVLKQLGVLDDALRVGDVVTNYQFLSQTGKELVNLRVNHHEVPAIGIHRADLQALLWQKLPSKQCVLGSGVRAVRASRNPSSRPFYWRVGRRGRCADWSRRTSFAGASATVW